ncbi:Ribonuclease R [Rosistilla ulvae]|uniref:Ribonuclease R n=1 Tax=Rosistilla ulvae TaxID=1930277 RepID=A0A517LWA2_9BACT|nr:ribonuclease R [Rosistilla ulvae]QDS86904.1 Ribonuclease R [Rosistilla ulvae]
MEVSSELADAIVRYVHSPEYRPCKPKQIMQALELPEDQYREVRRTVKWLVLQGQLDYASNHLVIPPGESHATKRRQSSPLVRGIFRLAQAGFGFIRQEGTGEQAAPLEDVFVPEPYVADAFDGDFVEARLVTNRSRSRGGMEGHIERVIKRATRQFSGTFRKSGQDNLVLLDGTHLKHPISVGDTRGLPLKNEDKVVVEVVQFPERDGSGGQGVIMEVLGSSKNPAVDTMAVMRQYGLPEEFSEEVMAAAREQADKFDESIPADRRDLTDLLTLTIDPYDARDFDDAISLQEIENDHWRLSVHIADVSHFIPEGSILDQDAKQRATSVYLPDRVVPMIPEIISNHLASLQPERVRYAKTVEIEFTGGGAVVATQVYNSAIRSDCRLTYEQVDQFLETPDVMRQKLGDAICDQLQRMHTLAMKLRARRMEQGSLEMDLPEIKIDLDSNGKVRGAHLVVNTESHQVIEEFMLAANQGVATWFDDMKFDFLRRIHPAPERRKLRQLAQFLKDIGIPGDDLENRHAVRRVLKSVKNTPLDYAVNYAVLKATNKAIYGPHREGHYALAMDHYCHFTSPIRRYPDLTIHRMVQKLTEGNKNPSDPMPVLIRLGHHCSDQEKNAEAAERELIRIKLLHHMNKNVGQTFEAVVTRVHPDGLYARGIKMPAEGYISIDKLPSDNYRFERKGHRLEGFREGNQFRLGDRIVVKIDKVDMQARELFYGLVGREAGKAPKHQLKNRAKPKTAAGKRYDKARVKKKLKQNQKRKR